MLIGIECQANQASATSEGMILINMIMMVFIIILYDIN